MSSFVTFITALHLHDYPSMTNVHKTNMAHISILGLNPHLTYKILQLKIKAKIYEGGPFSRIFDDKTPLFQPKSLILRLSKTPLFKQNAIFFVILAKVPFCESENICNFIKLKTFFYVRRIFHNF